MNEVNEKYYKSINKDYKRNKKQQNTNTTLVNQTKQERIVG